MKTKPQLVAALVMGLAVASGVAACAGPPWAGRGPCATGMGPMPNGQGGMMAPGMRGCGPGPGPGMGAGRGPGGWGGPGMGGPGRGMMMQGSMLRHRSAMMAGIPSSYAGLRDPLPANQRVVAQGHTLYQANCASCHGTGGEGDGPAASGLSPPPANLRWAVRRPMAGDDYLMWAISEGGGQIGTAMPAFKGTLSETDRWRIIRFLRTL